jgi:hypothetical protein
MQKGRRPWLPDIGRGVAMSALCQKRTDAPQQSVSIFGILETHSQYLSAIVQTYVRLGAAGPPACNGNGASPCASFNPFRTGHRTSNVREVRRADVAHPNRAGRARFAEAHF